MVFQGDIEKNPFGNLGQRVGIEELIEGVIIKLFAHRTADGKVQEQNGFALS